MFEGIPKYEIIELVYEGSIGKVYKAKSTETGDIVAVKQMNEEILKDEGERLKREAEFLKKVDSEYFIKVIESIFTPKYSFIVLEWCEGEDLERVLEKNEIKGEKYTVEETVEIISQVCEGLKHLHSEAKLIHRDIKPANLMLRKGRIKILDLGISKDNRLARITATNQALGTLYYMPPEQISTGKTSFKSDVFSLGATWYHLIKGVPPFKGKSFMETYQKARECKYKPLLLNAKYAKVIHLIEKMMEYNVDDRYDIDRVILEIKKIKIELEMEVPEDNKEERNILVKNDYLMLWYILAFVLVGVLVYLLFF